MPKLFERKPIEERRINTLTLRLNQRERILLDFLAQQAEKSVSEYVRETMFDTDVAREIIESNNIDFE